jgi:signal transduction histidine kinase
VAASDQPELRLKSIRVRLWRLLLQAFGLVVALTGVLLLLIAVSLTTLITAEPSFFRPGLVDVLEAYYLAQGSWDGVEQLPSTTGVPRPFDSDNLRWQDVVLVDSTGDVLLDHGRADTPQVGTPYIDDPANIHFDILVEGRNAGTLYLDRNTPGLSLRLSAGFLMWTSFLSFFPAVLTLIIALLLARRFISPLADVMAVAQTVAAGDLSARVQARGPDDLRALIESFNHMAAALEQDDRERRDMLADIAHELRTPLTVIRGRLEGIVEGVYSPDEAHIIPVLEEVYLLERLVEDLRLLTLAETRQLPLDLMPVSLDDAAYRAVQLLEAEALDKDITISLQTGPATPPVLADPQRVGQVIHNLLSNALRYVPAHGKVLVTIEAKVAGVECKVSDSGPGVPEAELPHIFDRFWRYDKSRTRSAGGAGLGLAIARQLVEAQGGNMQATNQPEGGLAVSFILPQAAQQ